MKRMCNMRISLHGDRKSIPPDSVQRMAEFIDEYIDADAAPRRGLDELLGKIGDGAVVLVEWGYPGWGIIQSLWMMTTDDGMVLCEVVDGDTDLNEVVAGITHGDTCVWLQSAARGLSLFGPREVMSVLTRTMDRQARENLGAAVFDEPAARRPGRTEPPVRTGEMTPGEGN